MDQKERKKKSMADELLGTALEEQGPGDMKQRVEKFASALRLHEIRLQSMLKLNRMTDATQKEIMDFVLDDGIRVTQSRFSLLGLLNEDESIFTVHAWTKATMAACDVDDPSLDLPLKGAGLWAEPIRQREAVVINDYSAPHPAKKGMPGGHVKLTRYMAVPIFVDGRIVCLGAVANKEDDYDEADIRALENMLYDMWRLIEHNEMISALKERLDLIERMNRAMVERELTHHESKEENQALRERIAELEGGG